MFEFLIANRDAGFILAKVQGGPNDEALLRGCARDQINDDLVGGQRTPPPVLRDETEQSMLELVPLAGAGRKVTDLQGHSQFVGQTLQRLLPQSIAAAVTAAPIRGNHEFGRTRKARGTHLVPPAQKTRACELGGVVIDADTDPTFVTGQVVNPVGNGLAQFLVGKVMNVHLLRPALGLPFRTGILEFSDQFFLFRVHRDDRLLTFLKRPHLAVDGLELSIAIRVRRALARLAVGLQAVAALLQQPCDRAITDGMILSRQLLGQLGRALQVQRKGDMGSPRVAGSINRSSAASKPGSVWISVRRPPPGDRTRAAATTRLLAESSNSVSPAMIVGRDKPVARAASEIPPQPASRASAAAHCLRLRSSNSTATKRNLRRIRASTFASCMRRSSHLPPQSPIPTIPICQSYFFALPYSIRPGEQVADKSGGHVPLLGGLIKVDRHRADRVRRLDAQGNIDFGTQGNLGAGPVGQLDFDGRCQQVVDQFAGL